MSGTVWLPNNSWLVGEGRDKWWIDGWMDDRWMMDRQMDGWMMDEYSIDHVPRQGNAIHYGEGFCIFSCQSLEGTTFSLLYSLPLVQGCGYVWAHIHIYRTCVCTHTHTHTKSGVTTMFLRSYLFHGCHICPSGVQSVVDVYAMCTPQKTEPKG